MECWVLENSYHRTTVLKHSGWGNGYVMVDPTHPLYGMHYDDISYNQIKVHGGLTYSTKDSESEGWVFGFHTSNWDDRIEQWPKEVVIEETKRLMAQLMGMEIGDF